MAVPVALGAGVLALLLHQVVVPGILHDDGVYLMLARGVAEGHGYAYDGVPGSPPGAKFPPLYASVLALYWRATGGDLDAVAGLAVWTNLIALVGSAVGVALLARRWIGLPPAWSVGCGLLVGLPASPWRYAMVPLSDAPGLLFAVLLVGTATSLERAPPGKGKGALLRFLLVFLLAFHLRTALLAVGAAGVMAVFLRGAGEGRGSDPGDPPGPRWSLGRGMKRALLPALGVVGLALPWLLLSRAWTLRIPVEFRDILGGYGAWISAMSDEGRGPLDEVLPRIPRVLDEVGRALVPGVPDLLGWGLLLLLCPLLFLGVGVLWRQSRSAVLALLLLALQGILWPFVDQRMVLPLLPWLVLAVVAGAHRVMSSPRTLPAPAGALLPLPTPALLAAWTSILVVHLGIQGWRPGGPLGPGAAARGAALASVVGDVREWVPAGGVVGAPEFWAILHLRTGHPVVPSTRFRPGAGREAVGTPSEQHRQWAVGRVSALVDEGGLHRDALAELTRLCGDGAWRVAAEGPGYRLILLTWDVSCRRTAIPGWQEAPPAG